MQQLKGGLKVFKVVPRNNVQVASVTKRTILDGTRASNRSRRHIRKDAFGSSSNETQQWLDISGRNVHYSFDLCLLPGDILIYFFHLWNISCEFGHESCDDVVMLVVMMHVVDCRSMDDDVFSISNEIWRMCFT